MSTTTTTALWGNLSPAELAATIGWGAVGATCDQVVTIMVGASGRLLKDVVARGPRRRPRGAGVGRGDCVKRAYRLFTERGLLAAVHRHQFHRTELVGGDVVLSPPFAWQEEYRASAHDLAERIGAPVELSILESLGIRELRRAYEL